MRLSHPRCVELRTESYDEQHVEGLRSGPPPGRALPGSSDRPNAHPRKSSALDSGVPIRRVATSALRAFFACAVPGSNRARDIVHHSGATASPQRGRHPGQRLSLREHGIELVELHLRLVVVRQSGGAFHLANDRIERAVRMLRGAEIAQARMRFGGEALQNRGREPRFPDTCLAGEQYDLAFSRLCPGPAAKKQFGLLLPARREVSGRSCAGPQSGSPQNSSAVPPKPAPARRCP